jgi:hypothetical protein
MTRLRDVDRLDTPAHRSIRCLRNRDQRPRALAPSNSAGRVGRIALKRRDTGINVADGSAKLPRSGSRSVAFMSVVQNVDWRGP